MHCGVHMLLRSADETGEPESTSTDAKAGKGSAESDTEPSWMQES